jgi:hypothetical protein
MNEPKAFLIISRYDEDFSWVDEYTSRYLIYNKGEFIYNNPRLLNIANIGGNQKDIVYYAYHNYDELPELVAFVQANPWDHCKVGTFDKLIYNECFTQLEDYGFRPANNFEGRTPDGKFLEINNSWYIQAHNGTYGLTCKYHSFDDFMNIYFKDYVHLDYLQFSPGSQYIVEKQQFLSYPKKFWGQLSMELTKLNTTESHIIERALFYILTHRYELR